VSLDLQVNTLQNDALPEAHKLLDDDVRIHRQHSPIDLIDPWIYLDIWNSESEQIFAWSDPETATEFIARGRLTGFRTNEPGRFAQAQDFCSRVRELLHEDAPTHLELPLFVGGFAFADGRPSEAWAEWAAADLWVPEEIIWTNGAQSLRIQHSLGFEATHDLYDSTLIGYEDKIDTSNATPLKQSFDTEEPTSGWVKRVEAALETIEAGKLQKVVLARSLALETQEDAVFALAESARTLREQHRACTRFLIGGHGAGTFLGASPETLLRRQDAHIESQALAGTARSAQSLESSFKDQEEHRFVVEAIAESLADFAELVPPASKPSLHTLKDLVHFETRITAHMVSEIDSLAILEALHPTPAVGGLPKQAAIDWIATHEDLERGWYAGPVGWLGARDEAHFVVAIRSLLAQENCALSYSGAGIVADSKPSKEWDETAAKSQTIVQSLRSHDRPGVR
jgi:isochorismate synthase